MMIELHEILDRFEILYPDTEELKYLRRSVIDRDLSSIFKLCTHDEDLRRAVVDENLHSIFRLAENWPVSGHSDDLRRALLENNLYSLFRLFPEDDEEIHVYRTAIVNKNIRSIFKLLDDEDLRKLITEHNMWKLWPLLERYTTTQFVSAFKNFFVNETEIDKDCFSRGQLKSKLWLVRELENCGVELGTVFLCAGWYATLATMLFESKLSVDKIRSFDIDPTTVDVAEVFNKPWFVDGWKFKALSEDINNINYNSHTWQYWSNTNNRMSNPISDAPDTIINTSCEHIANFNDWYARIPEGKLVVLQANDFVDVDEHVNTYDTLEDFYWDTPMTRVLYVGELELESYTRFMKIGFR